MIYNVILQDAAIEDATEYAAFIRMESQSRLTAERWLDGLEEILIGLSEMPNRFRQIDEHDAVSLPLRHVVYISHRIVYHVIDQDRTVHVLR